MGYIIQKSVVEQFLNDVITVDFSNTGTDVGSDSGIEKLSFKIINSFSPQKCKRSKGYPCVLANCLFSDSYIYSGAGPTYVSNFPLLTSGKVVGLKSTVHQTHIPAHLEAFNEIEKLTKDLRMQPKYSKCLKRRSHNNNNNNNELKHGVDASIKTANA